MPIERPEPIMFTVACPTCGQTVKASADGSALEARCPGCGVTVRVPADATRPADDTSDRHPPASPSANTLTHDGPVGPDAHTITYLGPSEKSATVAVGANAIPGYTILGELGRGGMGVVYKAREANLNRVVALKVLLAGAHGGASAVARFRTEAEAAAAVQHRHIVQVFAVGQHQGLPYMAMELIPGGSLADRLINGALDPKEAARVVEAIARGVEAAHEKGILHRDLKPANVLFGSGGEPKVADFGLAKLGDSGLTASGAVMGTPAYMSPEQARGETKGVGPATDVWALGAILYGCLSGEPPFRGRSAPETLRLVCEADPGPLGGVPRDLATIALKCLEKDPAKRYGSAGAVADDLARYLAGEPVSARPRGRTMRLARRVGRHRGPVYLAAGALLAAVVSFIVLSMKSKPAPIPQPESGPEARLPADLALVPPDSFAFVTVRPGDMWQRPEMMKLANGLTGGRDLPADFVNQADQMVENAIGLRPADIERATVVLRSEAAYTGGFASGFLVVLRTTPVIDVKPIRHKLEDLYGNFEPHDRRGRRYYIAKLGEISYALFKAGEHELVFGQTTEIEAAIDRMDTEPVDGPLSPALEAAARGHTLVVGARAPVALFDFALTRPAAGSKLAPELAPAMAQLRQAEATIVTLDLLPPAPDCPLPGADIEARVRFATDGKAAAALPALRDALRWIGRPDPRPATAGSEVLLVAVLKAAREAEVRQEGAEVVAAGGPRWSAADLTASAKTPVRTTEWKLKQIGLALHSYEATHGHFPPAVTRSPTGKPLFSWRVELLPFLEQEQLYFKLNRKEAWNHPDNKTLLEKVPDIYAMSSDDPAKTASGTRFVAVVGKGGVFDETTTTKLPDITDGTSNTLMVVEASEPVHWAEPRDLAYTAGGPVPILGIPTADVFWILLADGSPHTLVRGNVRPADFKGLFTRSGNELVDLEKLKRVRKGK